LAGRSDDDRGKVDLSAAGNASPGEDVVQWQWLGLKAALELLGL
jgi:hypothetical protein